MLSFVFFEMLDVDGSEFMTPSFKTPITPVRVGLRQSTMEGVRRVVLRLAVFACPAIAIDLFADARTAAGRARPRPVPVTVAIGHTHRIALPRAALETASPA